MDFAQLAFKRLDELRVKTADYIAWADQLLRDGCDAPSIAELASCSWDVRPDPARVERLFQASILELGLELPTDWYQALLAYACSLCDRMLRGAMPPEDLEREMLQLAEDTDAPSMLWIWIDLTRDLPGGQLSDWNHVQFNGALDLSDTDACIRRTAEQFIALCATPLPEQFPLIWHCDACGADSGESTFTETTTHTCRQCGAEAASRNMRFFKHRQQFAAAHNPPR